MTLPLYKDHNAPKTKPADANAGLWYDKFCNQWRVEPYQTSIKNWTMEKDKNDKGDGPKLSWIKTVTEGGRVGNTTQLEETKTRMAALLEHHHQTPLFYKLESNFVTGLGREHPVENGFAWHHILGTPYLPGPSVKGMVRAWAEERHKWSEKPEKELSDEEKAEVERFKKQELARIFGSESKSDKNFQVGSVIFLDALPITSVQLKADIMTPHYSDYYAGQKDKQGNLIPPADWHSPTPIPFLVVETGASFVFGILPRRNDARGRDDCSQVQAWLKDALCWTGAGAKTAVGYGRFGQDDDADKVYRDAKVRKDVELEEKRKAEEKQQALKTATGGKSELYTELYITSLSGNWFEDRNAFSQAGVIESWLERLEADPQPDAVALLAELVRKHFGDVMAEPDAVEGKKQKPKHKDRQRNFAKRMLRLLGEP